MTSITLPFFWNLSSNNINERLDASVKLISALEIFQARHVPTLRSGEASEEDEDIEDEDNSVGTDRLDEANAPDVAYSIRRLVRGLASPRESSRLGFAVALTELLNRINTVTCHQILGLIDESTRSQGSVSGQEERDSLFARLFGLTSLVQSGLLFRPPTPSIQFEPATLGAFDKWITELLAIAAKKSWLRESAGWTMTQAVSSLATAKVDWKDEAMSTLTRRLFLEDKVWTPEKVALFLRCQQDWSEFDPGTALAGSWKHGNILHPSNYTSLAKVLKESDAGEDNSEGSKASTGSWKPQVHFVWDIILERLIPASGTVQGKRDSGSLAEFFRIAVDESLFSASSSTERKYWGFQVFSKALFRASDAATDQVPYLFTKNFMRTFINHLSAPDRYLHKIARQIAGEILAVVKKIPTLGLTLVLQLTGVNGSQHFDRLTKSKTVESILGAMDAKGIEDYVNHMLNQLNATSEDEEERTVQARRAWIIEQLSSLIRNNAVPKGDTWVVLVLDFLALHGLFKVKKKSGKSTFRHVRVPAKPAFSDDTRNLCCTRLLSSLAELTGAISKSESGDGKARKVTGVAEDGTLWVTKVITSIHHLESDLKHVTRLAAINEEQQELWTKAHETIAQLRVSSPPQTSLMQAGELLLSATLLQRYCNGEAEIADDETLEAVINAISVLVPTPTESKPKKAGKRSKNVDASNGESTPPPPLDFLVDVLIGFLEQSTAYMRTVANEVFTLLSPAVERKETLEFILTQLERRDPGEELGQDMDDAEEGDVSDSDAASGEKSAESHDTSAQASEDDEEDDDVDDEAANEELRQKLEVAFGPQASDEDETEELMDDDQMMAIDSQLADIFKSRAKPAKADAQRMATHFKNRVLDLVDIFLKSRLESPLTILCILPLVDLITASGADEKQLADKASGILRSRFGKAKELPTDVNEQEALSVLEEIHTRARRAANHDILSILSQCSIYLSRTLTEKAKASVVDVYHKSLTDFATRKASSLNGSFFLDLAKRQPATAWELRAAIVDAGSKAVNSYRKCQVFKLMQVLISQSSSIDTFNNDFIACVPSIRDALLSTLIPVRDDALTAAQAKELFKLASQAVRQEKRISPASVVFEHWQPQRWEELRDRLAVSDRFKSSTALLNMCKQMVDLTKSSVSDSAIVTEKKSKPQKASKRKAIDSSAKQDEEDKGNRKKTKKA